MNDKKLYRSRSDKMVAGVCGGLGKYLNIDPTLIRLAFVLLLLGVGSGVLVYLLMAIIVPLEPESGVTIEPPAATPGDEPQ